MDCLRVRLGRKLKELREKQKLTIAQLAEASGIPEEQLSKLEDESSDFPIEKLFLLSPILKFKPSTLMNQCEREHKVRIKHINALMKECSDEALVKIEAYVQKLNVN